MVAAGRRHLPHGWSDLGLQLGIWFGFAVLYQLARGIADRNPAKAFQNGHAVFDFELRVTHRLYELTFQNFVDQRHLLATIVSWTYWISEFTVVGLAILFVYVRRHDAFTRFRNAILLANVIGWLVALTVSFSGHHRLTFRGHGEPVGSSAARFLIVSTAGFAVNEATYALLLGWSGRRYDMVLAAVLLAVAAVTYLLSRHWVFLRSEER